MGPFTEESDGETAGVLILLVPTVSFTVFSEQTQLCGFEWFFNFSKIRSAESRTRPWPLARLTTVDRSFNGTPCGCWGIIEECGKRPQCVADRCSLLVTRSRSSISLAPQNLNDKIESHEEPIKKWTAFTESGNLTICGAGGFASQVETPTINLTTTVTWCS